MKPDNNRFINNGLQQCKIFRIVIYDTCERVPKWTGNRALSYFFYYQVIVPNTRARSHIISGDLAPELSPTT